MKINKLLIFIIAYTIILSCNNDKKSITITDFSKTFTDSLYPHEKDVLEYTTFYIEIDGEVNDSIILEFVDSIDAIPFYFNGEINKKLSFDYYGGVHQIIKFKPYKATSGKLKIKYGLY